MNIYFENLILLEQDSQFRLLHLQFRNIFQLFEQLFRKHLNYSSNYRRTVKRARLSAVGAKICSTKITSAKLLKITRAKLACTSFWINFNFIINNYFSNSTKFHRLTNKLSLLPDQIY
jgi:hypothetical protein